MNHLIKYLKIQVWFSSLCEEGLEFFYSLKVLQKDPIEAQEKKQRKIQTIFQQHLTDELTRQEWSNSDLRSLYLQSFYMTSGEFELISSETKDVN